MRPTYQFYIFTTTSQKVVEESGRVHDRDAVASKSKSKSSPVVNSDKHTCVVALADERVEKK